MHEDFQVILGIMRAQLKGVRRSNSKFMSATNVSDPAMSWNVPVPGEGVRTYSDLSEQQQKYYNKVLD